MSVAILEREAELGVLEAALVVAEQGSGSVVLVSGEAGIGKSLVRAYLRAVGARATVLAGACDDLLTPRTLGALRDAVGSGSGRLAAALAGGDREAVFDAGSRGVGTRSDRRCWSSRTRTGPTRRPSMWCDMSGGGLPTSLPSS